jgi:hypothetical protein
MAPKHYCACSSCKKLVLLTAETIRVHIRKNGPWNPLGEQPAGVQRTERPITPANKPLFQCFCEVYGCRDIKDGKWLGERTIARHKAAERRRKANEADGIHLPPIQQLRANEVQRINDVMRDAVAILRRAEPVNWSNNFSDGRYDEENDSDSTSEDIEAQSIPVPIDGEEHIELGSVMPAHLPHGTP